MDVIVAGIYMLRTVIEHVILNMKKLADTLMSI